MAGEGDFHISSNDACFGMRADQCHGEAGGGIKDTTVYFDQSMQLQMNEPENYTPYNVNKLTK